MSDEVDIERARDHQRLVNAYHRVFNSEDGRTVLTDIKKRFGTDFPTFVQRKDGQYDQTHAAIRDGQRQVVLHIDALLQVPAGGDANVEKPAVTVET